MNEVHRLEYLDAMGIDSYMPRVALPNAPLSVVCEPVVARKSVVGVQPGDIDPAKTLSPTSDAVAVASQVLDSVIEGHVVKGGVIKDSVVEHRAVENNESGRGVSTKDATPGGGETVDGAAALLSVVGGVAKSQAVKPEGAVSGVTVKKMAAGSLPAAEPRFSLSCWRVSDDLLIIDSRHSELALPTESLLGNILQALGRDARAIPRVEVLSWPMYDDPSAPKHEEAARETIAAMLEGMLEAWPAKYCLLMGADASYFVLPAELSASGNDQSLAPKEQRYSDLLGKSFLLDELGVTAIVVPGLSDMLQNPTLKGVTWKAIQPLRVR